MVSDRFAAIENSSLISGDVTAEDNLPGGFVDFGFVGKDLNAVFGAEFDVVEKGELAAGVIGEFGAEVIGLNGVPNTGFGFHTSGAVDYEIPGVWRLFHLDLGGVAGKTVRQDAARGENAVGRRGAVVHGSGRR